jgi:hypothetical protein
MAGEPIHRWDLDRIEVYEAGASLLTLLAFPEGPPEKRAEVQASLCAQELRTRYVSDPQTAVVPQAIKPIYAFRTDEEIARDLRTVQRRHRDRLVAGRMAMAYVQEGAGLAPRLPPGMSRLSINALSEMVADDVGMTDSANVEARVWRPSLPVIHLAAAFQYILQTAERLHQSELSWTDWLRDRSLIELTVRVAEHFEELLARSRLGLNPDRLIKVRLIQAG